MSTRRITFRIGDLFPANDPLARWMAVCCMALNDLVLVNRRLLESLPNDPGNERAGQHFYDARLVASHLYELAKFLQQAEKRVPEVAAFIATLPEETRGSYERVTAIGPGGSGPFAETTERLRNHLFHYAELLPQAEDYEALKAAMQEHAGSQGTITGGRLADFRAHFADDIAVALAFPEGTDLRAYVEELRDTVSAGWEFLAAALDEYVETRPSELWQIGNDHAADA